MLNKLKNFNPKRILVCQQRQIGDVILATPCVELLKKYYPKAELHFITEKKCSPILENNPYIDKLWLIEKHKSFWEEYLWYFQISKQKFDLVVSLQHLPRLRAITLFSGAKVRLAATAPWYLKFLYTQTTELTEVYAAISKVHILSPLGIKWQGERPQIYLLPQEQNQAEQILLKSGYQPGSILVSLDHTHRQITRKWPTQYYAKMISIILNDIINSGKQIYFLPLYGPGEEKDLAELIDAIKTQGQGLSHILQTDKMLTLREMAACIQKADLHIGNCSAPRHMAAALNVPSLVALGATSQVWTCPGPHLALSAKLPCQPCEQNTCPYNFDCLTALKPETMAEAALTMLKQHRGVDL